MTITRHPHCRWFRTVNKDSSGVLRQVVITAEHAEHNHIDFQVYHLEAQQANPRETLVTLSDEDIVGYDAALARAEAIISEDLKEGFVG